MGRVWAEPAPGQSMKIHMEHDGAAYKALQSNGMTMEEGSRYGDFDVYVSDKVESAYVQCDFYTVGPEGKLRVEMWKTSMGNRIWLVLYYFAGAFWQDRFREGSRWCFGHCVWECCWHIFHI